MLQEGDLTVLKAQHDVVKVRRMRAANVHNLDVLVLHELFVVAVSVLNAKFSCEGTSRIHGATSNSNNLGI